MEEMKEVNKHNVYIKVPIEECWANTGKEPIGTRWVDVNTRDDANPDYRSRLVAQEIVRSYTATGSFKDVNVNGGN